MSKSLEKWRGTRTYGLCLLLAMLLFFYLVFKILTPQNFGSPSNLYSYLQSSIIYSVGGCGFYFIVVMGLFQMACIFFSSGLEEIINPRLREN